jgi:hypothetical protein
MSELDNHKEDEHLDVAAEDENNEEVRLNLRLMKTS